MLSPVFEIVATLGPASFAMARELARAGATALRLNASHLSPEDLTAALVRAFREARGQAGRLV